MLFNGTGRIGQHCDNGLISIGVQVRHGNTGPAMKRLMNAFFNSIAAWRQLMGGERAFQEEVMALALGMPLAFFISGDGGTRLALIGSILLVMIVEVLNTGIEAACNALSREFHADIKIAKDCGSLAVLMSILLAASVWALTLWQLIAG
jgi:diacylglycerol kinase (ATP)